MVGVSEIGVSELKAALPNLSGALQLNGLKDKVEVYRDELGIPHVRAGNEHDAFFAQGFVTAQDRLWHMEYDRLRGSGRWAEAVGDSALEQDKLMRRFRLVASARADYDAMDDHTRMVFDAYAAGVNAFILRHQVRTGRLRMTEIARCLGILRRGHSSGAMAALGLPGGLQGPPHPHGSL